MKTICFILVALIVSPCVGAEELKVVTEEFRPFQYQDTQGRARGFGVELITEIFKRADVGIDGGSIRLLPWARAYRLLQDEPNTSAFMTVRHPEREKLFKWVGPLAHREWWLFKLKARQDIHVKTLEDAKKYIVGGYRAAASTDYLQALGFKKIYLVEEPGQLTKMLLRNRLDLIPGMELMVRYELKQAGIDYDVLEKAVIFDNRYDYYLALNKKVSDETVNKLEKAFQEIMNDGTYQQLFDKYLK